MKILLVQKVHGIAGAENYLFNLVHGLQQKGADVGFLCLFEGHLAPEVEVFITKFEEAGIKTHKVGIQYLPTWRALKQIGHIVEANGYSIVQSNLLFADLFLACTKWLVYRQFVLVSGKHGYEENYIRRYGFQPKKTMPNAYYWLARFSEKFIDRSFAISKGLLQLYVGLGIGNIQKMEVIPYGFDFNADFGYRENLRFGSPQLCIVGRLSAYKGHIYAFQAVKQLQQKYSGIKLAVVGWGEMEAALKKSAVDLGISQNVCFVGKQTRARDYMATSDVILVPSVAEGFGIVILEAMSVKRPVVAFNVPSPNEILDKGAGVLVPPFDVSEFAEAVDRLLDEPDLATAMVDRAYRKLESDYSLAKMISAMFDFYGRALQTKAGHH